jgi:hypothetical protein
MSATTAAPHPRIAELLHELAESRKELLAVVHALPSSVREAPLPEGQWTVVQILEHLCLVEDGGGRLVSKLMKQAQEAGAFETDSSSILHSLDGFAIDDMTRRIEAPPQVHPKGDQTFADSIERLQAIRERLVTALIQGSGLALGTVSHPHPLFGPLTGYQWLLVMSVHERRHIAQIRRQYADSLS